MLRSDLKLSHKAWILISVPLIFELVFVATLGWLLRQAEFEAARANRSRAVFEQTRRLNDSCFALGTTAATYLVTHNPTWEKRLELLLERIPREIELLKETAVQTPRERELTKSVEETCNRGLAFFVDARKKVISGEDFGVAGRFRDWREAMLTLFNELEPALNGIEEEERRHKVGFGGEEQLRLMAQRLLLVGVAANIIIAVVLALYFNQGTMKRINVLVENTQRLARGNELVAVMGGDDEIGHLDQVFHKMADDLDEASRKRREIEQLKQQFVGVVSHDLRTPLTAVQFSLDLIASGARGEIPEQAKKDVMLAKQNVKRLIALINDLLDLEKMESGKLVLDVRKIDVQDLFEDAINVVRPVADTRGITIELTSCDQMIDADGERLLQVILNFLSNAIKYSPDNEKVSVTVTIKKGWLEARVTDNGPGIPAEFQTTIFDRFEQVTQPDRKSKGGSGLGLSIAKAIVDSHHGAIGVDSQVDRGSTFWFKIPVAHQNEIEEDQFPTIERTVKSGA